MKQQSRPNRRLDKISVPAFAAVLGGLATLVVFALMTLLRLVLVTQLEHQPAEKAVLDPGVMILMTLAVVALGSSAAFLVGKLFQKFIRALDENLVDHSSTMRSDGGPIHLVELRQLSNSARRAVGQLRRENAALRKLAYTDQRTGLSTSLALDETMKVALESASFESPMAFLLLDLDTLGQVTEQFGGATGEALISLAARRLEETLAGIADDSGAALRGSALASLSGGRFALCLPNAIDRDRVTQIARAIRRAFHTPLEVNGYSLTVAISGGIVLAPQDAETVLKIRRSAEIALEQVRKEAGTGFRYYSPRMNRIVRGKLLLEAELREGIAQREFKTVFQPKIDFQTGRVIGAEALVRWRRENGKIISPNAFIPLAEETGLINQIGEQVMEAACRSARIWMEAGHHGLSVAVNVSPRQFLNGNDLTNIVLKALKGSGLPPQQLELEITESMAVSDPSKVEDVMRPLRAMGVKLAIDDFGTGHSNLSTLTQLPFDVFKIDRQFVSALETDRQAPAIVEMILAMAETLGLETVAEGVETERQADFLRRRGCTSAQGFLYSKGLPHTGFMEFLKNWDPAIVLGGHRRAG